MLWNLPRIMEDDFFRKSNHCFESWTVHLSFVSLTLICYIIIRYVVNAITYILFAIKKNISIFVFFFLQKNMFVISKVLNEYTTIHWPYDYDWVLTYLHFFPQFLRCYYCLPLFADDTCIWNNHLPSFQGSSRVKLSITLHSPDNTTVIIMWFKIEYEGLINLCALFKPINPENVHFRK